MLARNVLKSSIPSTKSFGIAGRVIQWRCLYTLQCSFLLHKVGSSNLASMSTDVYANTLAADKGEMKSPNDVEASNDHTNATGRHDSTY